MSADSTLRFGRLAGDHVWTSASIRHLEGETDSDGSFVHLSVDLDPDTIEPHDQIRVSIFGANGMHYDQLVALTSLQHWFDLLAIGTSTGVPVPYWIAEPGTQVRVAPYAAGTPLQGRELLAMQITLDAPSGEGRYVFGRWSAEWPGSLWNSVVVTGAGGALHRAFAVTTDEIYDYGLPWRVFRVGHPEAPLLESYVGRDGAAVVWEAGGFVGIDLTPDLVSIGWSEMADAVLELDAIPVGEPDAAPRRIDVPLTAR